MPANIAPIFPAVPKVYSGDLTVASACTSRGSQTHTIISTGITPAFAKPLVPVSTNGVRVDTIQIQGASTSIGGASVACTVLVWKSNGTTAFLVDEIVVPAVTPSATTPAVLVTKSYTALALDPADTLWVSTTVATTAAANALVVTAFCGVY